MNKISQFFKKNIFPTLIILVVYVLAWVNYVPGTILSGWDTLHPEFNLPLYLKRLFWGVWQEHQGVGAVASQSHPAEIPRLLIIWLESLVLPPNLIRYVFVFFCLAVGGLGVYFVSHYLLQRASNKFVKTSAFLASIFYILNLTTIQQFYVPLEMFSVHFALIPWLFYWAIRYIKESDRKNILWFSLVTLFSSAMAHTATLYYVYIICLGLFLFSLWIFTGKKQIFKKSFVILAITFLLNSYWILPNLYFVKNHGLEVGNSKISLNFSNEAFLQSEDYGDFSDLALQKNFLFNWRAFDYSKNQFTDLLDPWINHLNEPYVLSIGYGLFALSLFGLILSFVKRSKCFLSFVLPLTLSVMFWINANGFLKPIFAYLRDNFDLFREGLRFPFTKFSIILIFILSIYLSLSLQSILQFLRKVRLNYIFAVLIFVANIYFASPAFRGYFIAPNMKVEIPNEYFQAFNLFSKRNVDARVAKLPMNTLWGWNFYSWHYEGAGFTWFGVPQPTFDREFDRWSAHNESFYNQASWALYAGDNQAFLDVLKKYQVKYLLLDESIVNAGGRDDVLYVPEIKGLIASSSGEIKEAAKFGFLTVFENDFTKTDNFVSVPKTYTAVNADLDYSQTDPIYEKYGDYISQPAIISYPFVNFDPRGPVSIEIRNSNLEISNTKMQAKVTLPLENVVSNDFYEKGGFDQATNCDLKKKGEVKKEYIQDGVFYGAYGGGVSCDYLYLPDLKYDQGYVLHIRGENKKGRGLKIYLYNPESNRMETEELLPQGNFDSYFVIYPKKGFVQRSLGKVGYTFNFETRSFGRIASENIISKVEFIPINMNSLLSLPQERSGGETKTNNFKIINVKKYGTAFYDVDTEGDGLLQLGQGYEDGWLGLSYKDKKITKLDHLKINSWANGWMVPEEVNDVYLIFWPQLLEWGGMVVGLGTFIYLLLLKK